MCFERWVKMTSRRNERIRILLEELQDRVIYLYGAGTRGKAALENLCTLGLGSSVAGFLDDSYRGEAYCGKPVYLTEEVEKFDCSNMSFIITTYAVNNMVCNLMKHNISPEDIYFFPELLINDIDSGIFKENQYQIRKVYDMLNDNLSKYIYKTLFHVYMDGNIGILSRTEGDVQYFPLRGNSDAIEEFCLSGEESFVDCGAYDGDTIREFKRKSQNTYKKIWAFEPDENNFVRLSDYIRGEQDSRVELYQAGVYDSNAIMNFSGNRGMSSTLQMECSSEGGGKSISNRFFDQRACYIY